MGDVIVTTRCESCGNQTDERHEHCSVCGEQDPWVSEPKYDFDDVDFPVVIEREHYDDHYGMWRTFCAAALGQYELDESQIANVPSGFPRMKYCVVQTYWKVTADYELKGPFLDEQEAREA
jgi:hypothetical protein